MSLISFLADGKFYSNEQICQHLSIREADINKYIQIIKNWGIHIYSILGEGHSLLYPIQLLDKKFICNQIKTSNIQVLPIVHSTNQYLLEHLEKLHSGDTCIAEYQQAGRGRRKRKWFSPFGVNIYFSMYWYLNQKPASAVGLSLAISIAIAEVLQELSVGKIYVKWPNDLYLWGRKLAGILIETKQSSNNNSTHLIIGVGINLMMHKAKENIINQNWINLQEAKRDTNRNNLIVQLIKKLYASLVCFEQEQLIPFLSSLKKLDNFINCPVKLIINENKIIYGISRGIDAQGSLLLEQNGIIKSWPCGEISMRSTKK